MISSSGLRVRFHITTVLMKEVSTLPVLQGFVQIFKKNNNIFQPAFSFEQERFQPLLLILLQTSLRQTEICKATAPVMHFSAPEYKALDCFKTEALKIKKK